MNILLHIGANKTGSTLIQEYVMPKLQSVLSENNIYYSNEIGHILGMHIQRPEPQNKMSAGKINGKRNDINKVIKKLNAQSIIVSREKYFGNPRSSIAFDNIEIIAHDLYNMLSDHSVKVIAYVRRQDTYIESNFQTGVKTGDTNTFEEFLDKIDVVGYKWDVLLDKYIKYFGRNNVLIFPYEDLLTKPQRFFDNFFASLNIDLPFIELPVVNAGLTTEGLELIRKQNFISKTKQERKKFRTTIESKKEFIKSPHDSFGLFSDDERKQLLLSYENSNENLFKNYIKGYDNIYSTGVLK